MARKSIMSNAVIATPGLGAAAARNRKAMARVKDEREEEKQTSYEFSFKSMESLLGSQLLEVTKGLENFYSTSLRLLEYRDKAATSAEAELKELKIRLDVEKEKNPHAKESKNMELVRANQKALREKMVEQDLENKRLKNENYELREQLAAMKSVGANASAYMGSPLQPPPHEGSAPESPDAEPPMLGRGFSKSSETTRPGSARSEFAAANALVRLERAQNKLDIWANQHHPNVNPAAAGMVDPSFMVGDAALPGGLVGSAAQAVGPWDGSRLSLPAANGEPTSPKARRAASPQNQQSMMRASVAAGGAGDEEFTEAEMSDAFQWSYSRSKADFRSSGHPRVLDMKERVRDLFSASKNADDLYHDEGCCQSIARNAKFENLTMAVIAVNAIWIGIELTHNPSELLINADPFFIVVENLFLVYFLFEICVRFGAYQSKCVALQSPSFIFDLVLVYAMILETWILMIVFAVAKTEVQFLDTAVLRAFRLLRLTRVGRVAKILRALPEVMILVKGIGVASRSVFFTVCLLVLLVYVFAIGFTQLLKDTPAGDKWFPTLMDGVFVLLFNGCFGDRMPELAYDVFSEGWLLGLIFFVFLIIGPLTVMNMIIGVLVEVVGVVATAEQDAIQIRTVTEELRLAMMQLGAVDEDNISRDEFVRLLDDEVAISTFANIGVDCVALVRDPDIIFAGDANITFKEFLDEVLTLRGPNPATVKDIVTLKKQLLRELQGVVSNATGANRRLPTFLHKKREAARRDSTSSG